MRIAVTADGEGGGSLQPLSADGVPVGGPEVVADLAGAVRDRERRDGPRWVWADAREIYPALLHAGTDVARCHDVALTEGLLLARDGRFGEPRSAEAAYARANGLPVPAEHRAKADSQPALFDSGPGPATLETVAAVYADQRSRTAERGLTLLAAAESAGALAAAEMTREGLPWRLDAHDALLTELLGPRPAPGRRPARLQELADAVGAAFGRTVNPDSPAQLMKAFTADGVAVRSTRSAELGTVDHPAVPPLLKYKELARLHAAHGWAWADTWVREGRFRPEYVVGGVVSGRWASHGGGALQIPKVVRRAVVADPGWTLVVADAAQLEPRILAALSGDRGLGEAAERADLYEALAGAFGGRRDQAKIALLSAMYGGAAGEALRLLAIMRTRFPQAYAYVESAARAGEEGRVVRSHLGRACPPPQEGWRELVTRPEGARAARDRGRFTRNFVVQASAAEWALVLLVTLRRLLPAPARLVFFQHDEVIVHAPRELVPQVRLALTEAGERARRLVFGDTPVRFPLGTAEVGCYADAK
ncbi:bifunctional 3'-5' exonuclease/DNA polymerase [Rhizohabitans arisaemae]|uniref:bifunctional 3'-5' exonuclease/DNA polymerase n=1 Tax=Rhizohabitans arisaemae TaxID=2720610 RepID=UPI0024B06BFB|nr:bifunctional 3'-5' exonuclease/DNA polymerase [Rhizohabitans arisaemae]